MGARCLMILCICISSLLSAEELSSEIRLKDFDDVISTLDKHYAFWWNRNITLQQLVERYKPLVTKNSDSKTHYILLNKLMYELHDGHGFVAGPFGQGKMVNAGFKVESIEDGIYVTEVKDQSGTHTMPNVGWKLISVNGIPVTQIMEQMTDYANGSDWAWKAIAAELLASVELKKPYSFLFSTDSGVKEIKVNIEKRSTVNYVRSTMYQTSEMPIVESKLLSEKTGYIRINGLSTQDKISEEFVKALTELKNKNIKNLVLDLRFSMGGGGERAKDIFSAFMAKKTVVGAACEYQDKNCAVKLKSDLILGEKLETDPQKFIFGGKMVALIGPQCRSSCEFLVGMLKYSKRARLIGDTTAGAIASFKCGGLPSNGIVGEAKMCLSTGPLEIYGKILDGVGIEPDKKINRKLSDLSKGEDTLVKEATKYFEKQ